MACFEKSTLKITRRKFFHSFVYLSFIYPALIDSGFSKDNKLNTNRAFPITIDVLKSGYELERTASERYTAYSRKAVQERFPNIAYLFTAFAISEKIHAENYRKILVSLGAETENSEFKFPISETKANLITASEAELNKIKKTYPDFLTSLKKESHDKAVVSCMYAWKSHQQHKEKINEIHQYSKIFFGQVAKKIEGMKLDFHVCEICGSTLDEAPEIPCNICNYPDSHYRAVKRPT